MVAGYTESFGVGDEDIWIIKIDKNGNKIWDKTFGGKDDDTAKSIIQTKDDGFVVVGDTESSGIRDSRYTYAWVIKLDKDGNKIWDKFFGGKYGGNAKSIIQTKDDGFIVVGDVSSGNFSPVWVIKLNENGNKIWGKTFSYKGSQDEANSVIQTKDGGFIIACEAEGDDYTGGSKVWIIKLNKNGNKIWDKVFGGGSFSGAYSIASTKDNGFVIAGYTQLKDNSSDVWIIRSGEKMKRFEN